MTDLNERDAVIRLVGGYMTSNAIRAAGQLGVFAQLDRGPQAPEELAAQTGLPADNLLRMLRLLLVAGLLAEDHDGRLHLSELGRLLVPDRPGSLASFAESFTSPLFQRAWDHLEDTIDDGTPAFVKEYREPVYDYLGRHEPDSRLFNRAMHEEATATAQAAADLIALERGETVVDLGGGDGTFLTTLLQANPEASGVVFDSAAGMAEAWRTIEVAGLTGRCSATSGDFFDGIPGHGTTYVLKSVLQDWGDADVVRLLRSCQRHMPAGARLLIIGNVLPERHDPLAAVAYLTDVCMLVISGGRERTASEFRQLLASSGFATDDVQRRPIGPLSTIEARPAA